MNSLSLFLARLLAGHAVALALYLLEVLDRHDGLGTQDRTLYWPHWGVHVEFAIRSNGLVDRDAASARLIGRHYYRRVLKGADRDQMLTQMRDAITRFTGVPHGQA